MDRELKVRNSWVPRIIDVDRLKYRCQQTIDELLTGEPGFTTVEVPYQSRIKGGRVYEKVDRYAFKNNGSNVLAVAHVDVASSIRGVFQQFSAIKSNITKQPWFVVSPSLDDRLGVYIILDVLPRMGINVDVLLTDQEESGNSTAQHFVSSKKYNWIFSFDRNGMDVVMYQYDTIDNAALLQEYGFEVGWGTFSDIAYLEHLGVAGFNFGCGYHDEHSRRCHAYIMETELQLEKFKRFYKHNAENYIDYSPSESRRSVRTYGGGSWYYDSYEYNNYNPREVGVGADDSATGSNDPHGNTAWYKDNDGTWVPIDREEELLLRELGRGSRIIPRYYDEWEGSNEEYDVCAYCGNPLPLIELRYSYMYDDIMCEPCATYLGKEWDGLYDLEKVREEAKRFGRHIQGGWSHYGDWDDPLDYTNKKWEN